MSSSSPLAESGTDPRDKRIRDLQALVQASKILNSSLELNEVLRRVMELATGLLEADRSTLFLVDRERQELWSKVAQGLETMEIRLPLGTGIVGHVINTGVTVNTRDVRQLPFWRDDTDIRTGYRTHSVLCIPLRNKRQEILGAVQVINKLQGSFTREDEVFLSALADHAVIALENALLHERIVQQEKLERDLALAASIQQGLLPSPPAGLKGLDMAAVSFPARVIGGDYYEFSRLGPQRYLVAIGDISGKGIPAALLMANLLAGLRALAGEGIEVAGLAARLNDLLIQGGQPDRFSTAFLGVLDRGRGLLTYTNAGHCVPLLVDRDGHVRLLEAGGLALGILEGVTYDAEVVEVEPESLCLLYTDGIPEAENVRGELYGKDRLHDLVLAHHRRSAQSLLDHILADVRAFAGEAAQSDDLTLVSLRITSCE